MAGGFPVGCGCDSDIVPKDKCVAPMAAAPAWLPRLPHRLEACSREDQALRRRLFDFDKAVLRAEGRAKLDELASKAGQVKLEVILAVGPPTAWARATTSASPKRAPQSSSTWSARVSKPTVFTPEGKGEAAGHRQQL